MVLSLGIHPNECVKDWYPLVESANLTNNLKLLGNGASQLVLITKCIWAFD